MEKTVSFITEIQKESVPEPDEIGNVIDEVCDLAMQINLEVDNDDVKELLDSHNQELTIDELIEMHEKDQDINEPDCLDPVQSENRMTVGYIELRSNVSCGTMEVGTNYGLDLVVGDRDWMPRTFFAF